MKKILIIDDSALMRRVMSDIINNTNEYIVAYNATNGVEGLAILEEKTDITAVICDINMPRMNGLELLQVSKLRGIKIPFIVFSSSEDAKDTITALELGALEFIKKPERILGKNNQIFESKVLKALHMADEVKTKYDSPTLEEEYSSVKDKRNKRKVSRLNSASRSRKLVALVCSTGGPKALQNIIPKLPANLAAPMLIVQHMPAGFTETLSNRLNDLSKIYVKEAEEGEPLKKGVVYVAKGGTHLTVNEMDETARIIFDDSPPIVGLKPCGNIMYKSLSNLSYDEIICVVLTGMGADGSHGILELSKHKDIYVIAQDEKSSAVYGMPKAVYERGLTDCVCGINEIADKITKKVGVL